VFDGRFRTRIERAIRPVGERLGRTGLSADHLTILGVVVAVAAAVAVGSGRLLLGFVLVVLSSVPDLLDGALAKASGQASQRGAFFDSVVDRVSDAVVLGGVAWHLSVAHDPRLSVLPFAVMTASMLVSYQRAKAESLGLDARGGLMERAERIVALCIGLLFAPLLVWVLWVMLVLTAVTAVQRFVKVWRQAAVGPLVAERQRQRRTRRESRGLERRADRRRTRRRRRLFEE
jgi:CDP-diacylglycerol--glycerol-3-phosphate 3-phosphatidyltransferase